jgi:hypothetical protein
MSRERLGGLGPFRGQEAPQHERRSDRYGAIAFASSCASGIRRRVHRGTAAALVLVSLLSARVAQGQNADPFFFGDDAALAAGAVVASSRDSGSLWYNPAGLAGLERSSLNASGTTFGIRIRKTPGALRLRVGTDEIRSDLSSKDIISVPNAVVLAGRLTDRWSVAGGLFVTDRTVRSAVADEDVRPVTASNGARLLIAERIDIQQDGTSYHAGGGAGYLLTPYIRVGASLFVTYRKASESASYGFFFRDADLASDLRGFTVVTSRFNASGVGVTGAVGVQIAPPGPMALGVSVRAPEVLVRTSIDGATVVASANAGGTVPASAASEVTYPDPLLLGGRVVTPARVLAGFAYALGPPESYAEVGVDIAHGLPASQIAPSRPVVVNGRVGARYRLAPKWILGGGLFSDRAISHSPQNDLGGERVDYYGLTLGVGKRTPLGLAEDPSPEALVLVTTLSLRAAMGFGESRATVLDADVPTGGGAVIDDVRFYELMPYLGSSITF